jgi:chromosome transmission fidelity protein 4
MFHNHLDYLAKNGYEYEESTKNQAIKEQQELLMKMLAVSKINILKKFKFNAFP